MITAIAPQISPLDRHLLQHDWTRLDYAGPIYQFGSGPLAARLELLADLAAGERWRVESAAIELPGPDDPLSAHAKLAGPLKFVSDEMGGLACVADLPSDVLAAASDYDFDSAAADPPVLAWTQCLTALATGKSLAAAFPGEPAAIARLLERAGYTASPDGAVVKVTLPLPGQFFEVAIEPDHPCGLKISVVLAELRDASHEVLTAARHLASEANQRLLLARLCAAGPPITMTAEVRLTMTRVHDAWLLAALESLVACIALVARPLAALQDPALAAFMTERG